MIVILEYNATVGMAIAKAKRSELLKNQLELK
jgi:hypothetical protein